MQKIIHLAVLAVVLAVIGSTGVASQQGGQIHDSQYPDVDVAHGASLYAARCAPCHGAQGDAIGGVNLRSGTFRNAITDRDLATFIRAGSQPAGMPPFALDDTDMAGVIAYLRNMNSFDTASVKTGDVVRGRAVFEGKGACTKCHRVGRVGSHAGPNLTDIGSVRSAGSIQRSLLEPASQMMPINRPVRLVTKDGTVINGRRLNEDTYSIQVMDDRERLRSVVKTDLREYTILTTSPMPSFKGTLSSEELSDLLGYLLSLKGQS